MSTQSSNSRCRDRWTSSPETVKPLFSMIREVVHQPCNQNHWLQISISTIPSNNIIACFINFLRLSGREKVGKKINWVNSSNVSKPFFQSENVSKKISFHSSFLKDVLDLKNQSFNKKARLFCVKIYFRSFTFTRPSDIKLKADLVCLLVHLQSQVFNKK